MYATLLGDLSALQLSLIDELSQYEAQLSGQDQPRRLLPQTCDELLERIQRIGDVDRMTLAPETVRIVNHIPFRWRQLLSEQHPDDEHISQELLQMINATLTELQRLALKDLEVDATA